MVDIGERIFYCFLPRQDREQIKQQWKKQKFAKEFALYQAQNQAGGKICLSLFRQEELEKQGWITEKNGQYIQTAGAFDLDCPTVEVCSSNLPKNKFIKPEKIRVGLRSILRDDVEIRSLVFGKLTVPNRQRPQFNQPAMTVYGDQKEDSWIATVRRGDKEYQLAINGERIKVFPEVSQPKVKECPEGYQLENRMERINKSWKNVSGEPACPGEYEVAISRYEYKNKRLGLCGGVLITEKQYHTPGIGGCSNELKRELIDVKEFNNIKVVAQQKDMAQRTR